MVNIVFIDIKILRLVGNLIFIDLLFLIVDIIFSKFDIVFSVFFFGGLIVILNGYLVCFSCRGGSFISEEVIMFEIVKDLFFLFGEF